MHGSRPTPRFNNPKQMTLPRKLQRLFSDGQKGFTLKSRFPTKKKREFYENHKKPGEVIKAKKKSDKILRWRVQNALVLRYDI